MEIIKGTNGFPYRWKAGRVEQLIRNILEHKAQQQLNVDRVMIINPTWLHENDLAAQIVSADPGFVICHNFVDPAVPKIFEAIKSGNSAVPTFNSSYFTMQSQETISADYIFIRAKNAQFNYTENPSFTNASTGEVNYPVFINNPQTPPVFGFCLKPN